MNADYSTATAPARTPTYDEIAQRAYELWEQDGHPDGTEQAHWLRAEQELSRIHHDAAGSPLGAPLSGPPRASERPRSFVDQPGQQGLSRRANGRTR